MDTHLPQYASSPRAIMWARSVQVQVRQSPTVRREGAPTAANARTGQGDRSRRPTRGCCESSSLHGLAGDLSWAPISQRA